MRTTHWSRRAFVTRLGLVTAGSLLAACTTPTPTTPTAPVSPPTAPPASAPTAPPAAAPTAPPAAVKPPAAATSASIASQPGATVMVGGVRMPTYTPVYGV